MWSSISSNTLEKNCKQHLHGFAVTHKCPVSLQTVRFNHKPLMRTARVPALPCYTETWGRGEMAHDHGKPRAGQDGDLGCLYPTPEACAIRSIPNPPQFRLCPAPGAPEGIQALTYPLPKLVPEGISALQSSALYLLMFCCTSKYKPVLCGLCVCSLSIPPSWHGGGMHDPH